MTAGFRRFVWEMPDATLMPSHTAPHCATLRRIAVGAARGVRPCSGLQ